MAGCSTRRHLLERFSAILAAPTDDVALVRAEEAAPIDDLPKHVSTLIILLLMFATFAHFQKSSSIYGDFSLQDVRCYDANAAIKYDEHHLYLRFNAHISLLNTIDNMMRVGVTTSRKKREKTYSETEDTGSVRIVYLCTGPTLHIYLMEALLIWLCKLL